MINKYKIKDNIHMNKKRIAYLAICIALGILLIVCLQRVTPNIISQKTIILSNSSESNVGDILNVPVLYRFTMPSGRLNGIQIQFATYWGRQNTTGLSVELICDGNEKPVYSWKINSSDLKEWEFHTFMIDSEVFINEGDIYTISISSPDGYPGNCVTAGRSLTDTYKQGTLYINGIEQPGDLSCNIIYNKYLSSLAYRYPYAFYSFILLFYIILCVYIGIYIFNKDLHDIRSIRKIDYVLVGFAIFISIVFFSHEDILFIHSWSKYLISAVKQGKILHYYTLLHENGCMSIYNILLMLVYTILMLPIEILSKLLHISFIEYSYILYFKVILVCLLLLDVYLMSIIMKKAGIKSEESQIYRFMFLSSPMLIFATIEFTQLDIIPLTFILLSLIFYMKRKYYLFSFVISAAIAMKLFGLLIFFPLILLANKRLIDILKYTAVAMFWSIVTRLLFIADEGYSLVSASSRMDFTGRLFSSTIAGGINEISMFAVVFAVICAFAYWIKFDQIKEERNYFSYMTLLSFAAVADFSIFVPWHPQYLTIVMPFLIFAFAVCRDKRTFQCVDLGFEVMYLLTSVFCFSHNVDNKLLNHALLPLVFEKPFEGASIYDIAVKAFSNFGAYSLIIVFSLFVAMNVFIVWLLQREIRFKQEAIEPHILMDRGIAHLRTGVLLILNFIIILMYFFQ